MTFISALKELWSRRVLVVLAVVIAAVAAILSVYHVSLSPFSLSKDPTSQANASTEILVDSAHSPIAGSKRDLEGLVGRAAVFARMMSGGDIVRQIAGEAGVPADQIEVAGPEPFPEEAPGVTEGAGKLPLGLTFTSEPELPIVAVTSRAPTPEVAAALATAAPEALRGLVQSVQKRQETPPGERVEIRVLGPARVGQTDQATSAKVGAAVFIGVLALELALLLGIPRLIAAWRRGDDDERRFADSLDISDMTPEAGVGDPIPTLIVADADGIHTEPIGNRNSRSN
ncbi:MAG TPA: hypothetical protein VHA76_13080 [Solirubrobacterales bacterium]|nr:hypothetical protein [Solirubrobacterales bacterium]